MIIFAMQYDPLSSLNVGTLQIRWLLNQIKNALILVILTFYAFMLVYYLDQTVIVVQCPCTLPSLWPHANTACHLWKWIGVWLELPVSLYAQLCLGLFSLSPVRTHTPMAHHRDMYQSCWLPIPNSGLIRSISKKYEYWMCAVDQYHGPLQIVDNDEAFKIC